QRDADGCAGHRPKWLVQTAIGWQAQTATVRLDRCAGRVSSIEVLKKWARGHPSHPEDGAGSRWSRGAVDIIIHLLIVGCCHPHMPRRWDDKIGPLST